MSTTPPAASPPEGRREGSLEAPTRHPIEWRSEAFYDGAALEKELERVFDICHGCRRCFNLCAAFPTLFDAVDATSAGEVHAVDKKVYWDVVDNCYLCDMCFMTKCPYVPPHPWNVDFPHLMLRAKAVRARKEGIGLRQKVLAATDTVGALAGIPVVVELVNAVNHSRPGRALLEKTLGVARDAPLPQYYARTARTRLKRLGTSAQPESVDGGRGARATAETTGRVALFATCYGNRNEPALDEDLVAIFEHNGIEMTLLPRERCCGMPRLELGDLQAVAELKEHNVPQLARAVAAGFDLVAPIPSCVLMFKQELPLMYPEDADVKRVAEHMFDPFEYLMLRHAAGVLRTDFKAAWARSVITSRVTCACRTSGSRPGTSCGWCRRRAWRSSSAARGTTAPTG